MLLLRRDVAVVDNTQSQPCLAVDRLAVGNRSREGLQVSQLAFSRFVLVIATTTSIIIIMMVVIKIG